MDFSAICFREYLVFVTILNILQTRTNSTASFVPDTQTSTSFGVQPVKLLMRRSAWTRPETFISSVGHCYSPFPVWLAPVWLIILRVCPAFIDAHEQEMEVSRDKTVSRTTWSEYKRRNTLKFLGAICGNGAFTFASTAYPGRITDPSLTEVSGFLDAIHEYGVTCADKGFMMHDKFTELLHKLEVPSKAQQLQVAFSSDQMKQTAKIARVRIHVERAFRRAQEFAILHRRVPISQVDLWGMIFRICCFLTNFQPPLIANKASNPDDTDSKRTQPKRAKSGTAAEGE